MQHTLVLATHNPNKVKEYQELLSPLGYKVLSAKDLGIVDEPEENGTTYQENSFIKAKALRSKVPYPVIADDSGIEIAALGEHFPGLYSARWAKEIGNGDYAVVDQKVIQMLQGAKDRSAAYHCCICLLENITRKPHFFEGICSGHILTEMKGNHGFGYDPIFHDDEDNLDFGLCSEDEKNAVSHRAKAFQKLSAYLATSKKREPSR
jgi:XTP/dITP diphosphohydrolase